MTCRCLNRLRACSSRERVYCQASHSLGHGWESALGESPSPSSILGAWSAVSISCR